MDDGPRVPESAGRSPAPGEGHSDAEGRARLPRRHAEAPDQDRRRARLLPRPREGVATHPRHHDRQDRRRAGRHRRLHRERSDADAAPDTHREPGPTGRPARAVGGRGRATDRHHPADVPPDGRPAQRRDRPARDADGTGLPSRGQRHAAHPPDPRPRHRQLHAGQRSRRTRPLHRLVPQVHGRHHRGEGPHLRPAVLGQVHLSRQQSRHQLLAGDPARASRVVPEDASAGDARPARVGAVPLHLLWTGAAESQSRPDRLRRAADVCQLRDGAAHQVRHARRVDPRLRRHVVARLPGLHGVEPQRSGSHVRDLRQWRRHDHEAARRPARGRRADEPRVVPPAAALPRRAVVAAQQHQLHADGRPLGAAVRVGVS